MWPSRARTWSVTRILKPRSFISPRLNPWIRNNKALESNGSIVLMDRTTCFIITPIKVVNLLTLLTSELTAGPRCSWVRFIPQTILVEGTKHTKRMLSITGNHARLALNLWLSHCPIGSKASSPIVFHQNSKNNLDLVFQILAIMVAQGRGSPSLKAK